MKKILVVLIIFSFLCPVLLSGINLGTKRTPAAGASSTTGWVNCGTLNVRTGPWQTIVGKIHRGDSVSITGESADKIWHAIQYNGSQRFVYKTYISLSQTTQAPPASSSPIAAATSSAFPFEGETIANILNVRKDPWGAILDKFSKGTRVTVVEQQGDWYRIKFRTGYAWVHSNYVIRAGTGGSAPVASGSTGVPASGAAAAAVAAALSQQGVPYVYATSKPGVSFDCSGFTMYAWKQAGVNLPHQSRLQYNSIKHVTRAEAKPGDLVFFYNPIHHVGMYLGNNQYIHAPATGQVVKIANLDWSRVTGIGRPGV